MLLPEKRIKSHFLLLQNTCCHSKHFQAQQQCQGSFRGSGVLKHGCASGGSKKLRAANPWSSWVVFHFVHMLLECFLGSRVRAVKGMMLWERRARARRCHRKCTWTFFFFFSTYTCFCSLSAASCQGQHIGRAGCCKTCFPSCLSAWIQFPVLDPGLFSPVRDSWLGSSAAAGARAAGWEEEEEEGHKGRRA